MAERKALDSIQNMIQSTGAAAGGFDPRSILFAASKNGIPMSQLPSLLQTLKRQPKSAQDRLAEMKLGHIEDAPESRKGELLGLELGPLDKRLKEAQITTAEAAPGITERREGRAEEGLELQREQVELNREQLRISEENQANTFLRLSARDADSRDEAQQDEDAKIFTAYMNQVRDYSKALVNIDVGDPESYKQLQSLVSTASGSIQALNGTKLGYVVGLSSIKQLVAFGDRTVDVEQQEQIAADVQNLFNLMNGMYDQGVMQTLMVEVMGPGGRQ